jgi:hypothetical protein
MLILTRLLEQSFVKRIHGEEDRRNGVDAQDQMARVVSGQQHLEMNADKDRLALPRKARAVYADPWGIKMSFSVEGGEAHC